MASAVVSVAWIARKETDLQLFSCWRRRREKPLKNGAASASVNGLDWFPLEGRMEWIIEFD